MASRGILLTVVIISILLFLVVSSISFIDVKAQSFTFNNAQVCNGWTAQNEPLPTNDFFVGNTVYLHYSDQYDQTRPIDAGPGQNLDFRLVDPTGNTVDTYSSRTWDNSQLSTITNAAGTTQTVESSYLEVMNVTDTSQIGSWEISIYNGNNELFTQAFQVEAGQPSATQTPSTSPVTPEFPSAITLLLILTVMASSALFVLKQRTKKP